MGQRDLALAAVIRHADHGDFSVGLTVSCHGTVVSGVVTARSEYWAAVKELFEEGSREAAEFSRVFDGFDMIESEAAQQTALTGPDYLHLLNAVIVPSSSVGPKGKPAPWRCRLDSIDAWAFGETPAKAGE
jgi:hypothetical protein